MKRLTREELVVKSRDPQGRVLLDLGCGTRKRPGHLGVDRLVADGVDIVCDLSQGLPVEDGTIDGIYSSFLFEHIEDTIFLFQELYRVTRSDAVIEFKVPYYQSVSQFKDPTHRAFIPPEMMRYFSAEKWYGSDYGINTNFKIVRVRYHYFPPFNALAHRYFFFLWPLTYPVLLFCRRFLWNVVHSITITLQVIKPPRTGGN